MDFLFECCFLPERLLSLALIRVSEEVQIMFTICFCVKRHVYYENDSAKLVQSEHNFRHISIVSYNVSILGRIAPKAS